MGLIAHNNYTGKTIITLGAVAASLAIFAVALRIWARKLKGAYLDASDWTCIAGLVVAIALLGSTVNTVIQGIGQPIEEVSLVQLKELAKGMLVGMFTWTASNTLVRISMILLYIRLFPTRKFVVFCWAFLLENVLCAIATFIAASLICQPFAYNWNQITITGHCGNKQKFWVWHAIQNLLSDIITITMPMPLLWGLHLPRSKKLSLTLVFSMGIGICIITLIRTIELAHADQKKITQDYASIGVLSIMEPLLGVINCTLPLLRPVLDHIRARLGWRKGGSSTRRPPVLLQSIGSKDTRAKPHDPYSLDTMLSTRDNFRTSTGKSYCVAERDSGHSAEKLVEEPRLPGTITRQFHWDVEVAGAGA